MAIRRLAVARLASMAIAMLALNTINDGLVKAENAERFRYAYIVKNVDCRTGSRITRQKYLSEVFGFCPVEVSKGQLLRDSAIDFRRAALNACGADYDVTYEGVFDSATSEQAGAERDAESVQARRDGYTKVASWHAALDYYSSRCR